MGLFDVEDLYDEAAKEFLFKNRYEEIANRFQSMFDLPLPLLVEDNEINLEKNLKFSPEMIYPDWDDTNNTILFYDFSKPINKQEFHQLMDLAFLWTVEGIILSNIDNICPENLPDAVRLISRILTEEDMSSKATFYGNPPTFLQFPSKNFDDPSKKGRIKVALICKEIPEYLMDKNIFCSNIQMEKIEN